MSISLADTSQRKKYIHVGKVGIIQGLLVVYYIYITYIP